MGADSVELCGTVESEGNQNKINRGQKQLENKISKNESSKFAKGKSSKNRSEKSTTIESKSELSSYKKALGGDASNDRSLVYDFDIEEPTSQSPHAKKKSKNTTRIEKNGTPIRNKTTQFEKSD